MKHLLKVNSLVVFCSLLFIASTTFGQKFGEKTDANFNIGLGVGIDYGGVGAKANYLLSDNVGVFAGLGFNTLEPAGNVGVYGRFFISKQFVPYVIAMYGYNGLIRVSDNFRYNYSYYGPSGGIGLEIHTKSRDFFWTFEVLYPYRPDFDTDADIVNNDPNVFRSRWVHKYPVIASVGFHFQVHRSSNKKLF